MYNLEAFPTIGFRKRSEVLRSRNCSDETLHRPKAFLRWGQEIMETMRLEKEIGLHAKENLQGPCSFLCATPV